MNLGYESVMNLRCCIETLLHGLRFGELNVLCPRMVSLGFLAGYRFQNVSSKSPGFGQFLEQ